MTSRLISPDLTPSERARMGVQEVEDRLERIAKALTDANVPFALIGGQAVRMWVGRIDKGVMRNTKDVDILLDRKDLPQATAAAEAVGMEYLRTYGVDMFVDKAEPLPSESVHIVWANEKLRESDAVPAPPIEARQLFEPERPVVELESLVRMKLVAYRLHDRTHVRDLIHVKLIDETLIERLPPELAGRLREVFEEYRREDINRPG